MPLYSLVPSFRPLLAPVPRLRLRTDTHTHRQTDRQTHTQTDRQTDTHTQNNYRNPPVHARLGLIISAQSRPDMLYRQCLPAGLSLILSLALAFSLLALRICQWRSFQRHSARLTSLTVCMCVHVCVRVACAYTRICVRVYVCVFLSQLYIMITNLDMVQWSNHQSVKFLQSN